MTKLNEFSNIETLKPNREIIQIPKNGTIILKISAILLLYELYMYIEFLSNNSLTIALYAGLLKEFRIANMILTIINTIVLLGISRNKKATNVEIAAMISVKISIFFLFPKSATKPPIKLKNICAITSVD